MTQRAVKDRNGRDIIPGDRVRVMGVPDLTGMAPQQLKESSAVFRYLVGRYETVTSIDERGNAQLMFGIAGGKLRGWHSVMIEPFLLNRPIQRRPSKIRRK